MVRNQPTAAPLVPPRPTLASLRKAAATCKACDLWKRGKQTVFGEGKPNAKVMFVGEQPGDREDIVGRPFVGAAGKLLDQGLEKAGIERAEVYLTNVVKHFKWVPQERGKRRIHKNPRDSEINACPPSLDGEIAVVKPYALACLGATAAQALLGKDFRVSKHRGELIDSPLAPFVMATVHPSSILRAQDEETRHEEMKRFVSDLKKLARLLS